MRPGGLIRVPSLVSGYGMTPASALWLAAAQGVLALCLLLLAPPLARAPRAVMGVVASTIMCAALIVGVPDPQIDLFYFLNEGARSLLPGLNPYARTFTTAARLPPATGPEYLRRLLTCPACCSASRSWSSAIFAGCC